MNSRLLPTLPCLPSLPLWPSAHSGAAFALALGVLLGAMLGACTSVPLTTPAPAPAPVPPKPVVVIKTIPPPPDEVKPLFAYQQSLQHMADADLAKELAIQGGQPQNARTTVRTAMVLMQSHGAAELARAQGLLESVASATEPEAEPIKPLAQMLVSYCAELRRLNDHLDKLTQQAKDSRRRIDQLSDMLEALKTIENTLPARAGTAGSANNAAGTVK